MSFLLRRLTLLLMIAAALALSTAAVSAQADDLAGTSWSLAGWGDPASPTFVIDGTTVTLNFGADGEIGGSGGCNSYGGNYTVSGETITFSDVFSTLRACLEQGIGDQENAYFGALQAATSYAIVDGTLIISYGDGQQLIFTAASAQSIVGTSWTLVFWGDVTSPTPVIDGSTLTLSFGADGFASGSGGCNGFGSAYTFNGDQISFEAPISTMMACLDEDQNVQETAYFGALAAATSFELTENQLVIFYGDGQQLVFAPAPTLVGSSWSLVSWGDPAAPTPVVDGSTVTLSFDENDRAGGNAGCNTYGTTYAINGDQISFSLAISTMMACADEALMAQETAYLAALATASSFQLSADQLVITLADGQQLVFAPDASIVGTTWQLASWNGPAMFILPVEGTPLTLEFRADGTFGGNAGCNLFNGSYQQDGASLTLSQAVSTRRACLSEELNAQEQFYLESLSTVSGVTLENGQLILNFGDNQQMIFDPAAAE